MGALTPAAVPIRGGIATAHDKQLLIQHISASELFLKSPRLRDFLLYAAECTLENRLADVREPVIAERVFNRSFDSQGGQDSIVRAEARNLRKRLEIYFETEGKDEPVIVTMPKGGYALAFQPREVNSSSEASSSLGQVSPAEIAVVPHPGGIPLEPAQPDLREQRLRRYRYLNVVLGLLALTAVALAWHWRSAHLELIGQLHITEPVLPFSALFSPDAESIIVTSDTGLLQISALTHRRISLDEYITRSYPDVPNIESRSLIRNWNIWDFTDGREMAIADGILRNNPQFSPRISMLSARDVQLHDFKEKSLVLIGSPISNPWAQLYEEKVDFHCELGPEDRILFTEKLASGTRKEYPNEDDIQHSRTYARIALIPGTPDASPALLIAGTTAQATQAAGELVLNRDRMMQILRSIGIDPYGTPRFFEILIRANTFAGGAVLPEVVAWRHHG